MLQAGLAVLIANLKQHPSHLSVKQHGSTACMCAASAATGSKNAPGRARCSLCQPTITSLAIHKHSMAQQPACVLQPRPQDAGMLQAGLAVPIASFKYGQYFKRDSLLLNVKRSTQETGSALSACCTLLPKVLHLGRMLHPVTQGAAPGATCVAMARTLSPPPPRPKPPSRGRSPKPRPPSR